MALPKLATAKYELTLPSTGNKVEYRPFLVKEEKILLTAQATGEESDMLRAVEQIIENCTFGTLKTGDLPFFDIEYVFIKLRSKSIGEVATVKILCPDDKETRVEVDINLEEVECVRDVSHNAEIKLTDDVGLTMEYPRIDSLAKMSKVSDSEAGFEIVKGCISSIHDAENVYAKGDMDKKELDEFIDSLSHSQFEKIQEFFDTMPKVKHAVKVKNPNTGVESEVIVEGMQNFF
tara:strand:- start:427 stop:1128 length:702 start_codon:yes stop_codon:yes gene_type:complete